MAIDVNNLNAIVFQPYAGDIDPTDYESINDFWSALGISSQPINSNGVMYAQLIQEESEHYYKIFFYLDNTWYKLEDLAKYEELLNAIGEKPADVVISDNLWLAVAEAIGKTNKQAENLREHINNPLKATATELGYVKIGEGIDVTEDGTISVSNSGGSGSSLPIANEEDYDKYLKGDGTWDTPAARHGSDDGSVVEGINTIASGSCSHAEGNGSVASGGNSHAEGYYNTASGHYSHAEGTGTKASGNYSHTEGVATVADHKSQHVFGEYNVSDGSSAASTARGNYIEIVGNGESTSNRTNARTLDWGGNEWLAGSLRFSVTGTTYNPADSATYVELNANIIGILNNLASIEGVEI